MATEQYPVLTASEGTMLTNGQVYSSKVYLGRLDKPENWREVPMSEYEAYLAEEEAKRAEMEAQMNMPEPEV